MLLLELLQTSSNDKPPVLTDPGDDGGPKGGEYWIHGNTKVMVKNDFATMVFFAPQEFDLSKDELMRQVKVHGDARTADMIQHELQRLHNGDDPTVMFKWLGARQIGVNILLSRQWGYVTYKNSALSVWVAKAHLPAVMGSISKQFPLMQLDSLQALVMKELWSLTPGGQYTVKFSREDFPGIAGMFNAIMDWVRTGKAPIQSWLYTIPKTSLDDVRQHGLMANGPTYIHMGNWTERNVYVIHYMPDRLWYRAWKMNGDVVRFPATAKPEDTEVGRDDDAHTSVLYSKQPFDIPPEQLQIMVGGYWRPLLSK